MAFSSFVTKRHERKSSGTTGRALFLSGLLLLVGGAGLAVAQPKTSAAAANTPEITAPAVTVATVEKQTFVARAALSGSVTPRWQVSVLPLIGGYQVKELLVDIGDKITAGETLALLDDSTLQASLTQAKAQAEVARFAIEQAQDQISSTQAQADEAGLILKRTESLVTAGSTSQQTLDQARATSNSAQASLASARAALASAQAQQTQAQAAHDIAALNLSHAVIKAPVAGIIAERNIDLGDVSALTGTPAFVIYRNGELEIVANVIETDLHALTAGDAVTLTVSGLPPGTGKVRLVAPTVNATSRLGTVYITPKDIAGLRSGLFAGGWITTDQREGVGVPPSAIQTDKDGDFVLVVTNGTVHRTPVQVGTFWNGLREIIKGLDAGQIVVARAGAFFSDGNRVTPITAKTK